MDVLHTLETADELKSFTSLDGLPLLPATAWQGADRHLLVVRDRMAIAAQASLWWHNTPLLPNQRIGAIGHYAALDGQAATLLLEAACGQLHDHHGTLAVGPMDGNTWRRYRLVSDRGTEPPFFLEPDTPPEWCDHFLAAGFAPLAVYRSALNTDLSTVDPRMEAVERRLQESAIRVRSLDITQFEAELQRIYALSLVSFRHNFLYTPIEASEFMAQYGQIRSSVQPNLVLLAEQDRNLVGFLFAIPDLAQAQRGRAIDTIIIKTVAVQPGRTYAGLGNVLVSRCQAIARELGYTRAIHALMHDSNNSRNLSARYAQPMRRYTLFSKTLP